MNGDGQLGIEYTIFEYHGRMKKPILNYRPAPGNIEPGLKLMRDKLGTDFENFQNAAKENMKKIREGTIKRR